MRWILLQVLCQRAIVGVINNALQRAMYIVCGNNYRGHVA